MSFKELLEKAIAPLCAFADRIDAQVERRTLQPALVPASPAFRRSTTSSLTLAAAPPPARAQATAGLRTGAFPVPAGRAQPVPAGGAQPVPAGGAQPVPAGGAQAAGPRKAGPPPVPTPTVQLEGPGGAFFRVPASTPVHAQVVTQSPDTGSQASRVALTLLISSDGAVTARDPRGEPYLSGRVTALETEGRTLTLTVGYQTGQAGQGTLFVGFSDGKLSYLSGSGTARDGAGRTVVRDISAVRPGTGATTTSSRRTGPGNTRARKS